MNSAESAFIFYDSIEPFLHSDVEILDKFVKDSNEELEGNCFYHGAKQGETFLTSWFLKYKRINLAYAIQNRNCKRVLEIGFNAGHSAAVFLNAMPEDGHMIVFDICDHSYTIPCANYLSLKHPQLKHLYAGDSRKTLPTYIKMNPEEKESYDLIHIDGGHSQDILSSDLFNCDYLLKKGGILILDDTQLGEMQMFIPILLEKGYVFLFQIPTFGFMHAFFEKT